MDKEAAIKLGKAYKEIVLQHFNAKDVILYGSYGKGTPHPDSDIDIAVIVDSIEGDYFEAISPVQRLSWLGVILS